MVAAEHVVGREDELAAIRAFLSAPERRGAALLLEGEPGIGKTTLWQAGIEVARAQGFRVLEARPAGAETELSFASLADLIGAADEVLLELPAPQRRALEVALLLEEAGGAPPGKHAVSLAFLNALRALARTTTVVLAVDDIQWLDAPSAGALEFAARRLAQDSVLFVLTRRLEGERGPLSLEDALGEDRLLRLPVGPISLGALHHLLHERLGTALSRPVLHRVHELSGGNPFFGLEIGRGLLRGTVRLEAGHELPVTLEALVRDRLAALLENTQRALAIAAAASQPTLSLVDSKALAAAVDANVVELSNGQIRFTHPLLAAGAYAAAGVAERRTIHLRLASVASDPEERARHLALAAEGPDEEVATTLEEAARHALGRGAPAAAAELCRRAATLTPADRLVDARRRALDAALYDFESGDARRAREALEGLAAELPQGPERAIALTRLARVRSFGDDLRAAMALHLDAIAEAGDDGLRAVAHVAVTGCLFRLRERIGEAITHADTAAQLARRIGDVPLLAESLATKGMAEAIMGRETARASLEAARALEGATDHQPIIQAPPLHIAFVATWWDQLESAREGLEEVYRRAVERGDESSVPYVLFALTQVSWRLGRYDEAIEYADEALERSLQAGQEWLEAYALAMQTLAESYRGHAERARAAGQRALELAARTSSGPADHFTRMGLGHLALSKGDPAEAWRLLEPLVEWAEREEINEPGFTPFVPDAIEALVELGRPDEAEHLLAWYESNARRQKRTSALAASARLHGLRAAARGEPDDAIAALERALAEYERIPMRLERARTLLALGSTFRRAKRKREARETLEEALRLFEGLDAAAWVERTRAELGRIGGRAPSRGALTPTEHRVAELVAAGRTNREVAAALFVSDRTVEGHLSRIYSKLGVRSRAELARRFQA